MRRTALVIAIFAIITCGLGSARADAAPAREQAAVGSPALYGRHCVAVRSAAGHQTGTVCVYVTRSGTEVGAELTFSAGSGRLKASSIKVLQLSVNNRVVAEITNVHQTINGKTGVVRRWNWWDEGQRGVILQVRAYQACASWTDGGSGCTGWLYSGSVRG